MNAEDSVKYMLLAIYLTPIIGLIVIGFCTTLIHIFITLPTQLGSLTAQKTERVIIWLKN
jgi:hypothetical protein